MLTLICRWYMGICRSGRYLPIQSTYQNIVGTLIHLKTGLGKQIMLCISRPKNCRYNRPLQAAERLISAKTESSQWRARAEPPGTDYPFLRPDHIYGKKKNSAKGEGLYYSGIWQELVVHESEGLLDWVNSILIWLRYTCLGGEKQDEFYICWENTTRKRRKGFLSN